MRNFLSVLWGFIQQRRERCMKVAGVQPLGAGVTLYAVDVDGWRIVFGASAHALCVLDRYALAVGATRREATESLANSVDASELRCG